MNNAIEVNNLNKKFKEFSLQGVSFSLPKGYIMGFIGPNGAGKTTTIKLILNMLTRDSGSIELFGKDSISDEGSIKESIGVVLDNPFYVKDWKLKEIEKALAPFYRNWSRDKYYSLLAQFHLNPQKKVKELSRGMKMKLMITAALSHDAELLILDEPTSGLDAVARDELLDILTDFIADENKSVLFSTHITSDLEKIADYITVINNGGILFSDTKDELLGHYCLIKGGIGVISAEQKKKIIGYREYSVGFDGLIASDNLSGFPESVIAEPCNLDEIVIRFNAKERNDG